MGDRVAVGEAFFRQRRRSRTIRTVRAGLLEISGVPDTSSTTWAAVTRDLTHSILFKRRRPSKHTRRDRKDG